jgi:hypothetical protein
VRGSGGAEFRGGHTCCRLSPQPAASLPPRRVRGDGGVEGAAHCKQQQQQRRQRQQQPPTCTPSELTCSCSCVAALAQGMCTASSRCVSVCAQRWYAASSGSYLACGGGGSSSSARQRLGREGPWAHPGAAAARALPPHLPAMIAAAGREGPRAPKAPPTAPRSPGAIGWASPLASDTARLPSAHSQATAGGPAALSPARPAHLVPRVQPRLGHQLLRPPDLLQLHLRPVAGVGQQVPAPRKAGSRRVSNPPPPATLPTCSQPAPHGGTGPPGLAQGHPLKPTCPRPPAASAPAPAAPAARAAPGSLPAASAAATRPARSGGARGAASCTARSDERGGRAVPAHATQHTAPPPCLPPPAWAAHACPPATARPAHLPVLPAGAQCADVHAADPAAAACRQPAHLAHQHHLCARLAALAVAPAAQHQLVHQRLLQAGHVRLRAGWRGACVRGGPGGGGGGVLMPSSPGRSRTQARAKAAGRLPAQQQQHAAGLPADAPWPRWRPRA